MRKLKEETIERLVRAYKKHLQKIRDEFDLNDLYGDEIIERDDFEEAEDLKLFTLYTSDKFDGNPNVNPLLVKYPQDGWAVFANDYDCMTELDDEVTHFMYLDEDISE